MNELEAAKFGKALGDVTRQRILRYCCCTGRSVGEIAQHVGVTQPTATHHLRLLQDAGLTHRIEDGKMVYYQVNQNAVVSCCGSLLVNIAPEKKKAHGLCQCDC